MEVFRPKVIVLLAVYNGRIFLNDQFASLIAQEGVEVVIYANDDGSVDGSYEILESWKENGLITKLTQSNQIGASQAFFNLLNEVDTPDWVAFCDQDDIWSKDKLYLQVNHLVATESLMSFCSRIHINSRGHVIGRSKTLRIGPSFKNALVENVSPGNTILLHPKAVNVIKKFHDPKVMYYDAWTYLLISGIGNCAYLKTPLVYYRLHNSNLVGIRKFRLGRILEKIESNFVNAEILEKNANHVLSIQNQKALRRFNQTMKSGSIFTFIYELIRTKFERQSRFDQIGFVILMILYYVKKRLTSDKK
jgi:glycosyltransferase involved in cell wall biosynthesis